VVPDCSRTACGKTSIAPQLQNVGVKKCQKFKLKTFKVKNLNTIDMPGQEALQQYLSNAFGYPTEK